MRRRSAEPPSGDDARPSDDAASTEKPESAASITSVQSRAENRFSQSLSAGLDEVEQTQARALLGTFIESTEMQMILAAIVGTLGIVSSPCPR